MHAVQAREVYDTRESACETTAWKTKDVIAVWMGGNMGTVVWDSRDRARWRLVV